MIADLSHVADSTMHATLDISSAPAFFSHSSARGLCGHPRNVPDDVLGRVRDTTGVVMVSFVPGFLNEECRVWIDAWIDEFQRLTAEFDQQSDEVRTASAAWRRQTRARRAASGTSRTTSSTSGTWPASTTWASAATSTA